MPQPTTESPFESALRYHRAGEFHLAEPLYREILAAQPQHAAALHMLGVLAHQTGRPVIALECLRKSIELRPQSADAHSDLGLILLATGATDEAIASIGRALALRPDAPLLLFNLGNAMMRKDDLDAAIAAFQQAIALKPDAPELASNLALAFARKNDRNESIRWFRRAASLRPGVFETLYNLATALMGNGQLDEAIDTFRRALALQPASCEAHNNLGNALKDKGRLTEAIVAYETAIKLKPSEPEAHYNLGCTVAAQFKFDDAIGHFECAIQLRPSYPEAHNNLGNALKSIGRLDDAVACYRRAAGLDDASPAMDALSPIAHSNLIYAMLYQPSLSPRTVLEECRRWNARYAAPLESKRLPHDNDFKPDRRLRIGYVSADFRGSAISLFIVPLLASHDHSQFEIHCFSNVAAPDDITARCRALADRWHDCVPLSDAQLAHLVRQERIDILIDLSLHTAGNRLLALAHRPAPLQITWLGYPGTTGLDAIDYRLTDPYMNPPAANDALYSEKSYQLPDSFWCYDPLTPETSLDVAPLPPRPKFTFGSLNTFWKNNVPLLRLWASVLRNVKNSQMLLLAPDGSARQWVRQVFADSGIEPDRVRFQPRMTRVDYLRSYHQVDIALDTFPYNGHTTSLDAMWMGVPVVTLAGKSAVSRAGYSHLSNLGLTDLVASTPEQFAEIATRLAFDSGRRSTLRQTLRQRLRESPLMDASRFARNIEQAYRNVWRTRCQNR